MKELAVEVRAHAGLVRLQDAEEREMNLLSSDVGANRGREIHVRQ